MAQLHESISIYNKSGVFERFENTFAAYHGIEYSLLTNSGTSALQSAYYALMLEPGDEVICPVYTFHATISPMMHFGLIPVMADCDEYGQLSVEAVKQKITRKTKAVVVTHMWGYVADLPALREICDANGLALIEDCSHAHGARFGDSPVGSYADLAIWSLQGQKIITGGEGGILLTPHQKYLDRAITYGHYNKRCKQQVADAGLRDYALTGAGLKLRASPLCIAMAEIMFSQLEDINAAKQKNASAIADSVASIDFLESLSPRPGTRNSWYAQVLQYDQTKTDVTRERFVEALQAEGLPEFDIPGSTGPLHTQPLFNQPEIIYPSLYRQNALHCREQRFPNAEAFHASIIKLPVWVYPDEQPIVIAYGQGLTKVSQAIGTLID